MTKKPAKKKSGSANLAASGRKALTIAVTPEERETIRIAAAYAGMASGPWVLQAALEAAKTVRK
jgi:uncharacterized protein (DUF1778 family)